MPGSVAAWLPTASRATPGSRTSLAGHGSTPNGSAPLACRCDTKRTSLSLLRLHAAARHTSHGPSPLATSSADQPPLARALATVSPSCADAPSARRALLVPAHTMQHPDATVLPP